MIFLKLITSAMIISFALGMVGLLIDLNAVHWKWDNALVMMPLCFAVIVGAIIGVRALF